MRVAGLVVLLLLCVASVTLAEGAKVKINASSTPIAEVAQTLSTQCGQQIVVDSGVTGTVTAELTEVDLEQVLDIIVKSNELKWQKLYAQPGPDGKITLSKVKAQVDALAAMSEDSTVIVYDPATKKQTVFARMEPTSEATVVDPAKLGLKSFYFISKPKVAAAKAEPAANSSDPGQSGKVAELRNQQLDAYLRMTPEERKAASKEQSQWLLSLPANMRNDMIRDFMGASKDMSPQERTQWRNAMRDALGNMIGGGRRPANRGGQRTK
jgi:type II secretory pathway component GspD/PulD (secretin)